MTTLDKIFVSVVLPGSLAIWVYGLPRPSPSWPLLAIGAALSVIATLFSRLGKIEARGERGMFASMFFFPVMFMVRKIFWPTVDSNAEAGGLLFATCTFTLAVTLLAIGLLMDGKRGRRQTIGSGR